MEEDPNITVVATNSNSPLKILKNGSVILLLIVAFLAGLFLSDKLIPKTNQSTTPSTRPQNNPVAETAFDSENATITGMITRASQDQKVVIVRSTTAKNRDEQGFPTSSDFHVYRYTGSNPQATVSASFKSITLSEQAVISLIKEDGIYKINGITYLAPKP